jgi:predicted O-methyltransferase YrrM
MPLRVQHVARSEFPRLGVAASWLIHSKETTNFTYDLTPINREHLAWYVAGIVGKEVGEIRGYLAEIDQDENLRSHIKAATRASDLRRVADLEPRYGRRIGWYAFVRALRPHHIVETGTDKGLGSCVLGAAVLANGTGKLTTIDINPKSGYLISGAYARVVNRVIDDSLHALRGVEAVDLFLHDSDHSLEYEGKEYETVANSLAPGALVLSDNAELSDRLPLWAEANHKRFAFFREEPDKHWYQGGGIGAAW